ncbi:MAG: hypothetical protein U0003_06035 [Vampirovibrionales bacterium]
MIPLLKQSTPRSAENLTAQHSLSRSPHCGMASTAFAGVQSWVNKGAVDRVFTAIEGPRIKELLIEDIVGFGLIRFAIDGIRGLMYGTGSFNWPAARERGMREGLSILTDIFIPGWTALGIGAVAGWWAQRVSQKTLGNLGWGRSAATLSQQFVPASSMRVLQHASQKAQSLSDTLDALAQELSHWQPNASSQPVGLQHYPTIRATLNQVVSASTPQQVSTLATQLAQRLGLHQLDGTLPHLANEVLKLSDAKAPGLLEDLRLWAQSLPQQARQGTWSSTLKQSIAKGLHQGLRIRQHQILGLAVGLLTTMASPLLITAATRWFDRRSDYPALQGLTRPPGYRNSLAEAYQKPDGWFKRQFPYVTQQLNQGNPLPLLGALLPMAIGLCLDTVNFRLVRPNRQFLLRMLDFGKLAPHTMQQQLATLYAFLISARLLSTREPIEYRERAVDSVLGWSMWILGTPLLTRWFGSRARLAPNLKDALYKTVGPWNKSQLRTVEEINALSPRLSNSEKALVTQTRIAVGRKGLLANIALLGFVEPIVSALWSQNSVETNAKQAWQPVIQRLLHPS